MKILQGGKPLVVALYVGNSKPESVAEFVKDFIEELSCLLSKGITHSGNTYMVQLHAFICDAPARAFL